MCREDSQEKTTQIYYFTEVQKGSCRAKNQDVGVSPGGSREESISSPFLASRGHLWILGCSPLPASKPAMPGGVFSHSASLRHGLFWTSCLHFERCLWLHWAHPGRLFILGLSWLATLIPLATSIPLCIVYMFTGSRDWDVGNFRWVGSVILHAIVCKL